MQLKHAHVDRDVPDRPHLVRGRGRDRLRVRARMRARARARAGA